MSPLTAGSAANNKQNDQISMMRMTQPSSTDSAAGGLLASDEHIPVSQSISNFGGQNSSQRKPPQSMMLNRNSSNRTYTNGERKPSIGGSAKRALPKIDHTKQIDKLRSITGKSEDFSLGATTNSNVQFSKPKIGIGKRESASHIGSLKNSRVGSKPDLRQSS